MTGRLVQLLLLFAAFPLSGGLAAASDWLQFRGPQGLGIAPGGTLPAEFGQDKNRVWETPVPPGFSSPVLTEDRIFITAYEGLLEAGGAQPTDVVLVCGGNGKVGQAAIQLATMAGAKVFAVEYNGQPLRGHANGPVTMLNSAVDDVAAVVRDMTGGHGADIVFNTVGSPYFEIANKAMAKQARQIFKEGNALLDEIIEKKKQGFGVPFGDWLLSHQRLRAKADEALRSLAARGVIRQEFLDQLLTQLQSGHAGYYGTMVWILMIFELWVQRSPLSDARLQ